MQIFLINTTAHVPLKTELLTREHLAQYVHAERTDVERGIGVEHGGARQHDGALIVIIILIRCTGLLVGPVFLLDVADDKFVHLGQSFFEGGRFDSLAVIEGIV